MLRLDCDRCGFDEFVEDNINEGVILVACTQCGEQVIVSLS